MKAAAKALAADLDAIDPAHKADYDKGEAQFLDSLKPLDAKIADMRKKYAGQPVTASEPVFGYQAGLIGLKVHNEKFALAVMNNAEPTPPKSPAFENDLKGHKVKAMLYNAQASEPAVARLVQMAKDNGIPVVGVSETEPTELDLSEVDARAARRARRGARRRGEVSALRFDNVTIRLGGRDILSAASFVVEDREFIGMLGANGAGKTTLMRAALGLTPVASGTISVLDQPVTRGNSSIGYMPQNRGASLGPASDRLRRRRQRGDRRALRLRPSRQGDAARNRLGARSRRRARLWRAARSANCRAASASACCSARRCSAGRGCCCSTSR